MSEKILLIGGGGHCKSCIDVIEQAGRFEIAGIIERPTRSEDDYASGYPVLGTDDDLPQLRKCFEYAHITVGQIKTPDTRIRLYALLKKMAFSLPSIVAPTACVSRHAMIAEGSIIMHQAIVNAGARVGRNCIINTKALIEHDAVIGDHCHIATSAVINGGVRVGARTFFGSSAVSREYIKIGEDVVVGCGTRIIKNVPSGVTVFDR